MSFFSKKFSSKKKATTKFFVFFALVALCSSVAFGVSGAPSQKAHRYGSDDLTREGFSDATRADNRESLSSDLPRVEDFGGEDSSSSSSAATTDGDVHVVSSDDVKVVRRGAGSRTLNEFTEDGHFISPLSPEVIGWEEDAVDEALAFYSPQFYEAFY